MQSTPDKSDSKGTEKNVRLIRYSKYNENKT